MSFKVNEKEKQNPLELNVSKGLCILTCAPRGIRTHNPRRKNTGISRVITRSYDLLQPIGNTCIVGRLMSAFAIECVPFMSLRCPFARDVSVLANRFTLSVV